MERMHAKGWSQLIDAHENILKEGSQLAGGSGAMVRAWLDRCTKNEERGSGSEPLSLVIDLNKDAYTGLCIDKNAHTG
jgi:hypothetical protein